MFLLIEVTQACRYQARTDHFSTLTEPESKSPNIELRIIVIMKNLVSSLLLFHDKNDLGQEKDLISSRPPLFKFILDSTSLNEFAEPCCRTFQATA